MHANGRAKLRITVLGGGFAGLEAAFSLRARLGARAALTLVSDAEHFLFKPNTIYIPFGLDPERLLIPLAPPAARRDIELVRGRVTGVDPEARRVELNGAPLAYDYLVIATGARMRPEEIPGLAERAETIWTPAAMLSLRGRLVQLAANARAGRDRRIVFVVPPGNKCAGPLYELVFMTETWLRNHGLAERVSIVFATYERSFIQAFGPKLHEVVVPEFERRGIEGRTETVVERVERREAIFAGGERIPYDLLVTFPPYAAAVDYAALPQDERGFLRTELHTRRVEGQERIFAPGDAGNFPVKQAFLAFLQSDAVAAEIAGAPSRGFDPVSMCVMEQFDTATFAQVPLELTDDPARPVAVRADANGAYRVGSSPAWRLGKKLLGLYLPFRFRAGLPFHEGVPWSGMELGLKAMSAALARR